MKVAIKPKLTFPLLQGAMRARVKRKENPPNTSLPSCLPKIKGKKRTFVLGFDPGKVNVGLCLFEIKDDGKLEIHKTGFVNDLTDLKEKSRVQDAYSILYSKLTDVVKYAKENNGSLLIAVERFLARGRFGSNLSEILSFQIVGLLTLSIWHEADFRFFLASEWKNAVNKLTPLKSLYKVNAKAIHNIDAFLIGCYAKGLITKDNIGYVEGFVRENFKKPERVKKCKARQNKVKS